MSDSDRVRWNARYRSEDSPVEASAFLDEVAHFLPTSGRALDVAGGSGRNAIWLAKRGLDVTMVDVSDEAISIARERSVAAGFDIELLHWDLAAGVPVGPWDVSFVSHYLNRAVMRALVAEVAPDGVVCGVLATTTNLERNHRPPLPYLLEPGEIEGLLAPLDFEFLEENWSADGRHEARFVAQRLG